MLEFTEKEKEYMASCQLTFYTDNRAEYPLRDCAKVEYLHDVPMTDNCLVRGSMLFWCCTKSFDGAHMLDHPHNNLLELAMDCNFSRLPSYLTALDNCGESWLHDALCASSREELIKLSKVGWGASEIAEHTYTNKKGRKSVIPPDAKFIAEWRLDFDIGLAPITPENPDASVLSRVLSVAEIEKLVLTYETEAGESMASMASGTYSDMVYNRAGSNLFWGLLGASEKKEPMTVKDLLDLCVLPERIPNSRGNISRGYAWLLDAMTTGSTENLARYLIVNWADYLAGFHGGLLEYTGGPKMAWGEHPIRPDSYIVARWRLENDICVSEKS